MARAKQASGGTRRKLFTLFGLGVGLLTALGPFGTYVEFNFLGRLIYWSIIFLVCMPIFEIALPRIMYDQRLLRMLPYKPRFALAVLASCTLAYLAVLVVEFYARGGFDAIRLVGVFVGVLCVGSICSVFRFSAVFSAEKMAKDINLERVKFFEVYPHIESAPLRWISMEDHYARVVCEGAEFSVHASMNNLTQLLENYPGMRIHRSHWVAYASMVNIVRCGRRTEIYIGDNTRLPVGGSYATQVERVFSEQTAS